MVQFFNLVCVYLSILYVYSKRFWDIVGAIKILAVLVIVVQIGVELGDWPSCCCGGCGGSGGGDGGSGGHWDLFISSQSY